jgi:DNA-directed RNA polymerase subunit RPC12/RpoP
MVEQRDKVSGQGKMRANIIIAIERLAWSCLFGIVALGFYGLSKLFSSEHLLIAILCGMCIVAAGIIFTSGIIALFFGWNAYPGSSTSYMCPKCGLGINLWRIKAFTPFLCPRCRIRMAPFGGVFKDKKLKTFSRNSNL